MVKVLMFSWEYPPHMVGGLGQHVFDLSRFLARRGVNIHIITPGVNENPDYQEENGVHVHRVGRPVREGENFKSWTFTFNSLAIREAVRISTQIKGFDLVHAHDWLAAYAGRSVARIFDLPLITTIHATEHGRNLGLHNRIQHEINEIEKNLALEADKVICCSNYMKEEICTLFSKDINDVIIIPNGVEPEAFAALPVNPRFSIDLSDKVVFFIGRLVPEKGVCQLVKAFPRIVERVPEARLYIGGKGPLNNNLEILVDELGIADKVIFTGFIRDEERNYLYHKANVAVFPSLYEPFGIVALEAMATMTPVIVGDAGGLAEIVEDGITGLKVKPGDQEAIAEAVIKVLTDDSLAQRLQSNASKMVESVYTWDAIARSTLKVYEQILDAQRKKETADRLN